MVREHEIGRRELPQRRRVRLDVRVPLRRREVDEQPRLEALVAVEDEDGQQPARQLRHDDARAAEVVALGCRSWQTTVTSCPARLHSRASDAGVDVRAGPAEQVPVPEEAPARGGRYVRWK